MIQGVAVIAIEALLASGLYAALASAVLVLHLLFILWVIFGAVLGVRRLWVGALHLASLVWAILVELTPWPCPLTVLELWLEGRAGLQPYQGGFLLHYLQLTVYPDISAVTLTIAGVAVCTVNLTIYGLFLFRRLLRHR